MHHANVLSLGGVPLLPPDRGTTPLNQISPVATPMSKRSCAESEIHQDPKQARQDVAHGLPIKVYQDGPEHILSP